MSLTGGGRTLRTTVRRCTAVPAQHGRSASTTLSTLRTSACDRQASLQRDVLKRGMIYPQRICDSLQPRPHPVEYLIMKGQLVDS